MDWLYGLMAVANGLLTIAGAAVIITAVMIVAGVWEKKK